MASTVLTDLPSSGGEYLGAAGQFVSAVLQTAGLYAQGRILQDHTTAIEWLGALCFSVSIIGGILSVAFFGNYKRAFLLLLGPILFMWMLKDTVPATATKLHFGQRVASNPMSQQFAFLGKIDYPLVQDMPATMQQVPRVSRAMAIYDAIVSSVVQGMVSVLLDTKNSVDLITIANERAYNQVLMSTSDDPLFLAWISKVLTGQCSEVFSKQFSLGAVKSELAAIQEKTPGETGRINELTAMQTALQTEIEQLKVRKVVYIDPELRKVPALLNRPANELYSCDEIWGMAKEVLMGTADHVLNKSVTDETTDKLSDFTAPPEDKVQERLKASFAGNNTNPDAARNIIAAYILKNALTTTAHSTMTSHLAGRARFNVFKHKLIFGRFIDAESKGAFFKIFHFPAAITYVQGLLLYLLSIAFPFFCLFLLLPGRMASFFTWFAMWLWVKSWDVGFAIVFYVRQVLWHYVTHGLNQQNLNIDWNDPSSVIAVIVGNDPLASLATYYTVIGIATCAVPLLTAHACLGANTLLHMVDDYMTPTERFSRQYNNAWKRFESATPIERSAVQDQEEYALAKALEYIGKNNQSDEQRKKVLDELRTGSGAYSRDVYGVYARAKFEWQWSDAGQMLRTAQGGATGRAVTQGAKSQFAIPVIEADVNDYNTKHFLSRQQGIAKTLPGFLMFDTGDQSASDEQKIPKVIKTASPVAGEGGEEGF